MEPRTAVISLPVTDADLQGLRREFPGWRFVLQAQRGAFDASLVRGCEVLACQGNAEMIRAAHSAKWVHTFSAGVDGLFDALAVSHPEGIPLTNSAGVYGIPIAEHSLALLMALSRHLDICARQMEHGQWQHPGLARELRGSTVGILGTGDIGTHLAQMVAALGATALGYKRRPCEAFAPFARLYSGDDGLAALLPQCDYLCVCLPGTAHTRGLLDARRISLMKPGVILTNIGRGHIIDTEALLRALRCGQVGGAGLDVTDPEPLPRDHPLWQLPNVLITPHCSNSSALSEQRKLNLFAHNLRAYLAGQPLPNLVDPQWEY
ncbi:MAG: D-2-hydroxyacid dehydrogenase [Eubacteriales bacterium]|nr:D-2-hydroxyacid dehydrogenase [Eubacteriales bacterium]